MSLINHSFKPRLKAYFIYRLGMFEYHRGWLKGTCPSCHKELKFGVNLSMNRTNCFVCGYNDRPLDIVMNVENLNYSQALNFLSSSKFEGIEFKEEKVELNSRKDFYLPENFHLLNQGDSQLAISARNYITSRGFDVNKMSNKGWGYCGEGSHFGYLIIPFYEQGKLVYFNARNYLSNGPKYNNPTVDITGVGKSFIWYNKDALQVYTHIYITEGAINAETMGDNSVASGGKFVSRYQINELIKSPVERFTILLDPDAIDKAIDLALKLVDYKRVKVVILPDEEDPNSLGRRKTMNFVYKTRFQNRKEIIKLK